jgi:hypothetical protein
MEEIDFEQEIKTRRDNSERLEAEDRQEDERHRNNSRRIENELDQSHLYQIKRYGTEFEISVYGDQTLIEAKREPNSSARKALQAVVTQNENKVYSAFGTSYYTPGQSRTLRILAHEFGKDELNNVMEQVLQELSGDCVNRKLEANSDLFISPTYNKNEKFQMKYDGFIYISSKNEEAYVVEVKNEPMSNGGYRWNHLEKTRFSRFLLPEKTLGKIADFRLGRIDNPVCCRDTDYDVKIGTLDKKSFWSVLHITNDYQLLKNALGFLMGSIKVADLQTCAEIAGIDEGWEDKGMISYLAKNNKSPVFFGVQQWADKEGQKQFFLVPVKERRRTKAGMKTTYYSEISFHEIETFEKAFKGLQLEIIPTLAYSNKVMDVLGE